MQCPATTKEGLSCLIYGEFARNGFCHVHDTSGAFRKNVRKRRLLVVVQTKKKLTRKRKIYNSEEREDIYYRYSGICYLCDEQINWGSLWHIDHIQPFVKGGSDNIDNLAPTHKICNELKSDKEMSDELKQWIKKRVGTSTRMGAGIARESSYWKPEDRQ